MGPGEETTHNIVTSDKTKVSLRLLKSEKSLDIKDSILGKQYKGLLYSTVLHIYIPG